MAKKKLCLCQQSTKSGIISPVKRYAYSIMNPDQNDNNTYPMPIRKERVVQPLDKESAADDTNPALNMLRNRIGKLYDTEPDVKQEIKKADAAGSHRSKHQQYMHEISNSGKSLAEIQTLWHQYYLGLSDSQKHEVWQEFYSTHATKHFDLGARHEPVKEQSPVTHAPTQYVSEDATEEAKPASKNIHDVKKQLLGKVEKRAKATNQKSQHLRSVFFGLSMGFVVMILMLFGFFNERFIAPFITPSKTVSSTPIIMDPTADVSGDPKLIIPKINLEVPIVFDEPSIREDDVQRALEDGVLHYATTSRPGEQGNGAIFGHSSNNILNRGKYKFAFVLLNRLEDGDVFYVQRDGVRYAYRVYRTEVVPPTQVSVLEDQEKASTMSLITCDPPGTTINRLVVVGEQISPNPNLNVASERDRSSVADVEFLPSDAPTLWDRIRGWF
jgi:sortase A